MNGPKTGPAKPQVAANLLMALHPHARVLILRSLQSLGRHFAAAVARCRSNPSNTYSVLVHWGRSLT
jgi:hypothetical protein